MEEIERTKRIKQLYSSVMSVAIVNDSVRETATNSVCDYVWNSVLALRARRPGYVKESLLGWLEHRAEEELVLNLRRAAQRLGYNNAKMRSVNNSVRRSVPDGD